MLVGMRRAPVLCALCLAILAACGGSDATPKPGATPDGGIAAGPASDAGGGDAANADAGADAGPVTPTVSSWLGTNVSGDLPRVDITYQMNGFDTAAAQKDARGYPIAGASGTSHTDLGFVLPTGDYTIRYRGTGKVTVGGIATLNAPFAPSGDAQKTTVHIKGSPGVFGQFLDVKIENAAGQSVTDLAILAPGAADDGTVFRPEFIALLAPFRALRFMDWEATNDSTLVSWADRPTAAHFGKSANGEPYEHIIELANVTGKDLWITIPEHVDDDFIHQLGKLLLASLDFGRIQAARAAAGFTTPFQLIVENSNETWNGGFTAKATFLAQAKANPTRYTGVYDGAYPSFMSGNADLMKVGQYEADRLVTIADILKQELGAQASIVAPVLSGWALAATYSDVGLRFIKANYGDPAKYVTYVAHAPYFGADDADTDTLAHLFPAMDAKVAAMETTFDDFKKLGQDYGVQIAAYEGGQGLTGTTNQPVKHLAQHDARMFDSYAKYFALWKKVFGDSLFMHFSLADNGTPPEFIYQYGFWGSIVSVLEDTSACRQDLPTLTGTEMLAAVVHHCPKYAALAAQVP